MRGHCRCWLKIRVDDSGIGDVSVNRETSFLPAAEILDRFGRLPGAGV